MMSLCKKSLNKLSLNNKSFRHFVTSNTATNRSIHVDSKDDAFFNTIKDWWDPNGNMYTLHSYNDLRINYLKRELCREGLVKISNLNYNSSPFKGLRFLDVGCGGGIFCESLTRMGGDVVGVDSNKTSFDVAYKHLDSYEGEESVFMKKNLNYYHGSVDNYKNENKQVFDVVSAMEVIEHVNDPNEFVKDLSVLSSNYILISTINKNMLSYHTAILLGEKILKFIPEGTHDWNKFIEPEKLEDILYNAAFKVVNISGVLFNPFNSKLSLIDNTSVNYILLAKKISI
jgi:2-polyprenyl-6-hydroxyphenyl methylase/3-demethylubiquinone-9 3-methyltransferase